MEASLAQVAVVILYFSITITSNAGGFDPCKRQPFRGRCPSVNGKTPTRSQFVLRYYFRDNQCVSYPFGHCSDDEDEPKLFRYKEDCEKACFHKATVATTKSSSTSITEERELTTSSSSEKSIGRSESIENEKQIFSTREPLHNKSTSTSSTRHSTRIGTSSTRQSTATIQKTNKFQKSQTECERQRHAGQLGLIKNGFTPVCSVDGSFRALQCEPQDSSCFCVDHKGVELPYSRSNNTRKPDCSQILQARKPSISECAIPPDSGPCTAKISRWYYDGNQQQCIQFQYSGCGGNGNNYRTKSACEKRCTSSRTGAPRCKGGLEPLKTANGAPVNCLKNACPSGYLCSIIQFSSVCCPDNFLEKKNSPKLNLEIDVCQLPKERGSCDHYELRFYYNNRLGECKYFFYGGCGGNGNNFERVEDCERTCRQHKTKIVSGTVISAPQLITQGPQLKKINKEFATKSILRTGEDKDLEQATNDNTLSSSNVRKGADSSNIRENAVDSSRGVTVIQPIHLVTSSAEQPDRDDSTNVKNLKNAVLIAVDNDPNTVLEHSRDIYKNTQEKSTEEIIKVQSWSSTSSSTIGQITTITSFEPENTISVTSNNDFDLFSIDPNEIEQRFSIAESTSISPRETSKSNAETEKSTTRTSPTIDETGKISDMDDNISLSSFPTLSSPSLSSPSSSSTVSRFALPDISTTTVLPDLSITTSTAVRLPSKVSSDDRCMQVRDRGTCAGQFIRWHWDSERGTCQVFTYSGCGGNGNNFASRSDCFSTCHRPTTTLQTMTNFGNVCEHPIDSGDCTGVFQRFAFDSSSGVCRPFIYSGCGGNGNNFGSGLECRNKCIKHKEILPMDVCQHPVEIGECLGVFPRFAYDLSANECRPFTYSGCGGNGNNFGTMVECRTKCVREQSSVPAQCAPVDVSRCTEPCILHTNRHGCKECICPVAQPTDEKDSFESTRNEQLESNDILKFHPSVSDAPLTTATAQTTRQPLESNVRNENESFSTSSKTELSEKCTQPMDAGPCKNFIERWFFNVDSGLCQSFQYGGCAGNRNHFFSEYECKIHCARFLSKIRQELSSQPVVLPENARLVHKGISEGVNEVMIFGPPMMPPVTAQTAVHDISLLQQPQNEDDDTCVLPPDAGSCFDYVPRWFYNSQTGKCEQFSYGSCGGNTNNFLERQTCEEKCAQSDLSRAQLPEQCTQRKDEGYGGGYNVKWYFNIRNLRCEQIVYQGLGGNSNQFQTLGECQAVCTPLEGKSSSVNVKSIQQSTQFANNSTQWKTGTVHLQTSEQRQLGTLLEREHQRNHAVSIPGKANEAPFQPLGRQHAVQQGVTQFNNENVHTKTENVGKAVDIEAVQKSGMEQYSTTSNPLVKPAVYATSEKPFSSYSAQPLQPESNVRLSETVAAQETLLRPSPPLEINYQNGTRANGLESNGAMDSNVVLLSNSIEDVARVPSCPNDLKPMQYLDGRPLRCLPGRNQCPNQSVCYFNGVDFFCCPDPEDPYDVHVFGGYGGEEVKRGYKSGKKATVNINELIARMKKLRLKRQVVTSSTSQMFKPVRLDSNIPHYSMARAEPMVTPSGGNSNHVADVCLQEVDTGKCTEAHLRFFFDKRIGNCRLFYYSGCGGNQNNFATEAECREQCKSEDAPPGSCPFGESPLGDNAPVLCGNGSESFGCPKGYYCRMGPPNICCPQESSQNLEKILALRKSKNIRYAPRVPEGNFAKQQHDDHHEHLNQAESEGQKAKDSVLNNIPPQTCPDGTDALLDESTRKPLKCGAGFDGESLCPVGYYCWIDTDQNGRLCCPMGMIGIKIPPPPNVPPFFGLRPSNPGEVIPRGSLPSDILSKQEIEMSSTAVGSNERFLPRSAISGTRLTTNVKPLTDFHSFKEKKQRDYSSENHIPIFQPAESDTRNELYGRLMFQADGKTHQKQAFYNTLENTVGSESETDGVQIDTGEVADPFELLGNTRKTISNRSICHLKPTEGRTCREDEPPPRTNLQYFYSNRDKRCKLYFYRGCGGNQNRFDTKRHCELTCNGA